MGMRSCSDADKGPGKRKKSVNWRKGLAGGRMSLSVKNDSILKMKRTQSPRRTESKTRRKMHNRN